MCEALARLSADGLVQQRPTALPSSPIPAWCRPAACFSIGRAKELLVVEKLINRVAPAQLAPLEAHVQAEAWR